MGVDLKHLAKQSRDHLTSANLRLVVSIARKYINQAAWASSTSSRRATPA